MAHLQLLQAAQPIFDKNEQGGSYIITSSVAGVSTGGSSMGYSVTKAAGLHLMKCLAASQGSKLRINAVLPGLFPDRRFETVADRSLRSVADRMGPEIFRRSNQVY